ncbi:MAG: helix-turn-helix domain-containing protein [Candidatus Hodarchaeales archaeon]
MSMRKQVGITGQKRKSVKQPAMSEIPDQKPRTLENSTDYEVLQLLNQKGGMTRGELVRMTNIPRSTLYDSLSRLQLYGLVNKFKKKAKSGPGRPLVVFESIYNSDL